MTRRPGSCDHMHRMACHISQIVGFYGQCSLHAAGRHKGGYAIHDGHTLWIYLFTSLFTNLRMPFNGYMRANSIVLYMTTTSDDQVIQLE